MQCVATSHDLHHWTKHPERTIATPPPDVEVHDFRDPYVFQHSGQWFMVVGASYRHERGQALLYQSTDGVDWDYRGPLFTATNLKLGVVWECPNFFPVDDQWVLTVSIWQGGGAHAFVGDFSMGNLFRSGMHRWMWTPAPLRISPLPPPMAERCNGHGSTSNASKPSSTPMVGRAAWVCHARWAWTRRAV